MRPTKTELEEKVWYRILHVFEGITLTLVAIVSSLFLALDKESYLYIIVAAILAIAFLIVLHKIILYIVYGKSTEKTAPIPNKEVIGQPSTVGHPTESIVDFLKANKSIAVTCWGMIGVSFLFLIKVASSRSEIFAYCEAGRMTGLTAYFFVASLLIWNIALKKRKNVGLIIFALIFVSVAGIKSYIIHLGTVKDQTFGETMVKVMRGGKIPDNSPLLAVLFQSYLQESQEQWKKMQSELTVGLDVSPLEPKALANLEKIKLSKDLMQRNIQIIEKYRSIFSSMPETFLEKVKALPSDDEIGAFINGFNETKKTGTEKISQLLDLYKQTFESIYKILTFFENKFSKYMVQRDQILFQNDQDLHQYELYKEEVEKLVALESRLEKETFLQSNTAVEQ